MLTKKKRSLLIIIVGALMNASMFTISYELHLPLWLDTTGTIYTTIILGFPAGFLVGLINNIFLFIFFYRKNSLFFYIVSAGIAFVSSFFVKKTNKISIKNIFVLILLLYLTSLILCVPLTYVLNDGVPTDYWSQFLFFYFRETLNYSAFLSTCLSIILIKALDVTISVFISFIFYCKTPNKIKDEENIII